MTSAQAALDGRVALRVSPHVGRWLLAATIVVAVGTLLVPMFQAPPANLTSDESLYLSEAYNIATGVGPKYTSQEWVNHRAPLYPALLAIPLKLSGGDPDSAYWVSKAVVLLLTAATFLAGWRLFGVAAGAVAALLISCSAFLRFLGTTLYLDGTLALFLLLGLVALWQAQQSRSIAMSALAGALFGAAFLTKEAAIQWLPLPIVFALVSGRVDGKSVRCATVCTGAMVLLMAGWWLWVYLVTGRIYFWGPPDTRLLVSSAGAAALAGVASLGRLLVRRRAPFGKPHVPTALGLALLLGWVIILFVFLELTSWPYPKDHLTSVPGYLWRVAAPNTAPWLLVLAGIVWACWRCSRDRAARLIAIALALYLPFALFVANRDFAYRDLLPMVYLAYICAGALCAQALRWLAAQSNATLAVAVGALAIGVLGWAQTAHLAEIRERFTTAEVTEQNWDNELVHSLAAWIHDNVPDGAGIMSSRLYFSHLYVLDGGRHPVYQLPTVRVEPQPGERPFLRRVTTLFRWEDHRLGSLQPDERWLYVGRSPIKRYYIALSEHDLLRDLRERKVDYLVLTGEDAGFSRFAYLDYFLTNPAFRLLYSERQSNEDGAYVFRIQRERLAPRPYRAAVSAETLAALEREAESTAAAVVAAIDPDGVKLTNQRQR